MKKISSHDDVRHDKPLMMIAEAYTACNLDHPLSAPQSHQLCKESIGSTGIIGNTNKTKKTKHNGKLCIKQKAAR